MNIKHKVDNFIQKVEALVTGSDVAQTENSANGEKNIFPKMPEACLKASEEAHVLLKNNGALPLKKNSSLAVFGRCQIDYFYVGYGSGGDIHAPYYSNIIDSLKSNGIKIDEELYSVYQQWCCENPANHGFWGHWPMSHPEMPLEKSTVLNASSKNTTALVIIGRAAGEDRENRLEKGSYYLTDNEVNMLDLVTECFAETIVVMDCGNIIDMSWTEKYGDKINAVIYAWQCGMESCNALANILTGKANPSGKLADTIAKEYEDYPSAKDFGGKDFNNYSEDIFTGYRYFESFSKDTVLYPFGFGLSYTDFKIEAISTEKTNNGAEIKVKVTNTGKTDGKETVQLYLAKPKNELSNPTIVLAAFEKTKCLAPNESQEIVLFISEYDMCSFDDTGASGYKNAYVLLGGKYEFYIGNSSRNLEKIFEFNTDKKLYQQLEEICPVKNPFNRIIGRVVDDKFLPIKQSIKIGEANLRNRILKNLPKEIGFKGYKGKKLNAVKCGEITLDDFIAQLTNEELEALTRGEGGMDSSLGVSGNAGAFGGVIQSLRDKGVPPIITTDGPAGIRIKAFTSLLPCGTALACTWNTEIVNELMTVVGNEMKSHKTDVLLAPGMNIHRNVLCGRNFEYFSEDPYLSGKMAGAYVTGIQKSGLSACPKHFACNNQETRRTTNDSRVSQRALREIYLKGFEICVKESKPLNIMTSYNKINGVWSHYNYDLVTTVLRKEWGYTGNVMTDWWMKKSSSPEFPEISDNAYRVRAQVDVYMPGDMNRTVKKYKSDGTLLKNIDTDAGITRAELERSAKNVLNLALKIK
ncbi:MAG: glycoside hydrolase family 3 C-terminal domain-containing protein [Acetobacter sp.]|nr:glycoside hydrolase family 3 C-terminal domain-containing protein [Bacteroides sp.]MCM1341300.1 glycoside hydrolase family 3 C-terminal domain-containing protein [Acetobacter sp.]MCM1433924.1 glycoside hydrolase family 3 C-terminal domain-containing protein [Clostridiales bacterium]